MATICSEMAEGLEAVGRHGEAVAFYERCVAIEERVYGPRAEALAISQYNLANCLAAVGRRAEAREWFRKSAGICSEVRGPDAPETLDAIKRAEEC